MSNQSADLLNMRDKNNSKSGKILKTQANASDKNIKKLPAIFASGLNGDGTMDTAAANGFELFTRFAYCQSLLYKAWVEASDELARNLAKSVNHDHNISKEITSLYIDTFEETFTSLFRSPEFASNLGKLLNSLMGCIKEKDNASEIFLNGLSRILENLKLEKEERITSGEVVRLNFDNKAR